MKLLGTEMMMKLVPVLSESAVKGGACKHAVDLLRTLCAMAETDDYEEILRLQGAARFIADGDKGAAGALT